MRKTIFTYLLLIPAIVIIFYEVNAQNGNGFDRGIPFIHASFLRENIVIEPDVTFFNVLIVKNLGNTREEILVDINLPIGWSIIATDNRSHILEPGDSIAIPVRAAPSRVVEGEIGYSIIAAINDRRGELLTNAYSFVKIPRKSDLRIRPLTRFSFFDQASGEANFSFLISNRGNTSEMVFLVLESTRNVSLPNERENILAMDMLIRAKTDTVISLRANRIEEANMRNGSLYRVDLSASSQDRTFNTSFWFDHLSARYKYIVPESEKILVVELAAQNLLSNRNSYLVGGFRGITLLPENRNLRYNFYKFGTDPDILRYSRIMLEYNAKNFSILGGDIFGIPIRNGFGKGASLTLHPTPSSNLALIAGRNPFLPINNFGLVFNESHTSANAHTSYSYSDNSQFNIKAHTAGLGSSISLGQNHSIRGTLGFSTTSYEIADKTEIGYGLLLDYFGTINKTTIRVRENFGSINYYGNYAGRHELTARVTQPLNETLSVDFMLNDRAYRPWIETSEGIVSENYQNNSEAKLIFRNNIDRNMSVYGGPVYQRKETNSFAVFDGQNPFASHSAKFNIGTRVRDGLGTTFNPAATFGYTFVTNYSIPPPNLRTISPDNLNTTLFNAHVSINLRRNFWGAYINYFYGPVSVNQEISEFYFNISANSIRAMPFYEKFIYRDILKLNLKSSLIYDFSYKTSRVILNGQLDAFLKNDISISLLNTYSYQLTTDLITEDSYTYSNNYFELRLKKEFNWNQPRVKYYDIEMQLFIDLNGNLKKDANEPGVKDILVSITSIDPVAYSQFDVDYAPQGNMVSKRLLTGIDGKIVYENLPKGLYKVELNNIGRDQGRFFPEQNEFIINVTGDKVISVPYLERNKIFGRVILNRSRLSTLGRIEPSNIKITAVDSRGREMSTLSDANGYFEMYVPSVDSYVVSINNIFRDHFTLRQNNFRANLNGFKQFEVNFVFDEIRRQIEFTPSQTDIQTEIRRVGRTNLSGIVRDAATLQPLRAQIEIVDNRTGNTIRQANTDRNSGRYTTSFATGEDLMIVVTVNGYWMHSERLILDQFLTIQDVERDVLLEAITIGARFQLNNLRFMSNASEIPTEAMPELDRLISQLRQNPNVRIRIEGHSDAVETLDNPNISMQRAEIVMRYMVQRGFSNIEFTGLRDSRPMAPSDTEDNRRRNRRVEIIVIDR